MNDPIRLSSLKGLKADVELPRYTPQDHGAGIVHLGPGAFHRAHQAVYTDDALAASGGDWRITAISLRSRAVAEALNSQNGLYTLLIRGASGTRTRIIASMDNIIAAVDEPLAVMAALIAPATRIVSLTVTEKAYGIDRSAGTVDIDHPAIAADLADPRNPVGILGLIVESLRQRRAAGARAFTVLSCDNLPDNGALIKTGVLDFATRIDPDLTNWINTNASFPSTMVDRITPASGKDTQSLCRQLTGQDDHACIETEQFTQWVIEDDFVNGRPDWEAGGALFVADVAPYESMKLRMLNGAHSMLAYAGFLCGCTYVRDVMMNVDLAVLVEQHMQAAAATLQPLDDMDYAIYARELADRFKNPTLAHATSQIAMDGTEKLPQRILLPAVEALGAGQDVRPFAFAVAAWMRFCIGRTDDGETFEICDPRVDVITNAVAGLSLAQSISTALHDLPGIFPKTLVENKMWREQVDSILSDFLLTGASETIAQEAGRVSSPPSAKDGDA